MIKSMELKNFKCFAAHAISFSSLTLLAGLNSMGKSTVLQAMLVLRQSYLDNLLPLTGLSLNGELVELGTAHDILFEGATDELISIGLDFDDNDHLAFSFSYDQAADVLNLSSRPASREVLERQSLFNDNFQSLEAERIGPRSAFEMSDFDVRLHRRLGRAGEYTAHYLALFASEPVSNPVLRHPLAKSPALRDQVEAWMSEISPGVRFHYTSHASMDMMNLRVSFSGEKQVSSNEYRTTNVGFGLIYSLPIVVAALAGRPGSLLLVENPEAHLHPRAQVKMGELIARAAASGNQIIFETHSDHVLNGIRLAVHGGIINPSEVRLHYFSKADPAGMGGTIVRSLTIDKDGRIEDWPEGFFDEFERSLGLLMEPPG